jgi:hypothetical protein
MNKWIQKSYRIQNHRQKISSFLHTNTDPSKKTLRKIPSAIASEVIKILMNKFIWSEMLVLQKLQNNDGRNF